MRWFRDRLDARGGWASIGGHGERRRTSRPTVVPKSARPGLWRRYGVEIEMMIVDAGTLAVRPCATGSWRRVGGPEPAPARRRSGGASPGPTSWPSTCWSSRPTGPRRPSPGWSADSRPACGAPTRTWPGLGARLMPGAVHPWMDPGDRDRLWPHEYTEVYHTFDRIFGCSGHGWANLQSTHLNLPFSGDEEFGTPPRRHPAGAPADSGPERGVALPGRPPGARAGRAAGRLPRQRPPGAVRDRAGRARARVHARRSTEEEILGRIYRDMAPQDPEGVLRHEWANARGAIARFGRGTIEVRVIDAQECPAADLAVVAAVAAVVRALTVGELSERDVHADPATETLAALLERTTIQAEQAEVEEPGLRAALGLTDRVRTAGEAWRELLDRFPPDDPAGEFSGALQTVLAEGPLARRLVRAAGDAPERVRLHEVYGRLCGCLAANEVFEGA